jgi:hypothetical protein
MTAYIMEYRCLLVDSGRVGIIQPALDFLFLVLLSGFGCGACDSFAPWTLPTRDVWVSSELPVPFDRMDHGWAPASGLELESRRRCCR